MKEFPIYSPENCKKADNFGRCLPILRFDTTFLPKIQFVTFLNFISFGLKRTVSEILHIDTVFGPILTCDTTFPPKIQFATFFDFISYRLERTVSEILHIDNVFLT